jgi:hypothetical protein
MYCVSALYLIQVPRWRGLTIWNARSNFNVSNYLTRTCVPQGCKHIFLGFRMAINPIL